MRSFSIRRVLTTSVVATVMTIGIGMGSAQAAPISVAADIVALVDESGSMSGEHAWLAGMVTSLEASLIAAGVGDTTDATPQPNAYALVGFGGGTTHEDPHKHAVGGGDWGTAADLSSAAAGLVITGSFEDGWDAMDFAQNNYAYRGAPVKPAFLLVTDEDRDNGNTTLTYDSVLQNLLNQDVVLNVVVNCGFQDGAGATALGIDADGNAYLADGSGGFTQSAGGQQVGGCFGTTNDDYVDMALATGGAAWDLNQLRQGGLVADSFTAAFVEIKVEEIVEPPIPEPNAVILFGVGALLLGSQIRRRGTR